ncbi:MAG: adenylyl-sulfate kinase [Candidatus Hodarchaeota archaeon]
MSFVIWLTGPSGAGKTVLADTLERRLKGVGYRAEVLDGDMVRHKLYPDIGFSKEARRMHNRVVIHMAKLLSRNGVIVIISLISPYREIRDYARQELSRFIEVYLKCPLDVRIQRDPKGLYAKAISGEIKGLTGYDGAYEEPENPEVILDTHKMSVDQEADLVIGKATEFGYL